MQRVGLPEDPYTLHSVVNNLFVDRSLVRVVVPAPTFDFFFFFFGGGLQRAYRCPHALPSLLFRSVVPGGYFSSGSYRGGEGSGARGPPRIQYRSRERNHHSRFKTKWAFSRTLPAAMDDQFTGDPFCHSADILTSGFPP